MFNVDPRKKVLWVSFCYTVKSVVIWKIFICSFAADPQRWPPKSTALLPLGPRRPTVNIFTRLILEVLPSAPSLPLEDNPDMSFLCGSSAGH